MVLLRIYGDCLLRALRAIAKSPWTLLIPVVYAWAFAPIAALLAGFGILSGFLIAIVYDALLASYLYVLAELVSGSLVRLREMPQSMKPYFWPLMNVLFVIWIAQLLLGPLLARAPNAGALALAASAVLFVLFNAVPEVIYQRPSSSGLATLGESISFIQRQWLEWFLPNIPIGLALWFGVPWLARLPAATLLGPLLLGIFVHLAMVFRGNLFAELLHSNPRQRALRDRLGR